MAKGKGRAGGPRSTDQASSTPKTPPRGSGQSMAIAEADASGQTRGRAAAQSSGSGGPAGTIADNQGSSSHNEARLSVGDQVEQSSQTRLRGSQRATSETKARHRRAESNASRASDDTDWRVRRKSTGTQQQKHSSWHGASGQQARHAGRMSDFAVGHTPVSPGYPTTPATPTWRGGQDTSPLAEYESWRRREPPPAYLSPVSDLSHFQDYMSPGTPYPVAFNSPVVPNSPTVLMPLTQIMPMTPVLQQYSSSQSMQGPSSDVTHQEAISLDSASVMSSTASPSSSPSLSKRNSLTSEEAKKTLQNSPLSAIALAEVAQQAALQRVEKNSHLGAKSRSRRVSQSFEMSEELSVLLNSEPTIPQPIPSLFTTPLNDQPQRATLVNPSRTSNVYIRGLPLDTTDDGLYAICRRFGSITSSKAIIDVQSGTCKGFGFCEFKEESSARDCIVALTHYGYQVSFAKDSFNDRLVNLRDSQSTNLYLSNLPSEFNESDLDNVFYPHRIVSQRILRDADGRSRGVGFARFETREDCDAVIDEFNGHKIDDAVLPLQIRYADSPDQKRLKSQTQQRRQWRAREYNILTGKFADDLAASLNLGTSGDRDTDGRDDS